MKSYGVTIQMKPLQQYFCMTPFVFQYFKNEVWDFSINLYLALLEKKVNPRDLVTGVRTLGCCRKKNQRRFKVHYYSIIGMRGLSKACNFLIRWKNYVFPE